MFSVAYPLLVTEIKRLGKSDAFTLYTENVSMSIGVKRLDGMGCRPILELRTDSAGGRAFHVSDKIPVFFDRKTLENIAIDATNKSRVAGLF